jgi:glycosyltransferase involved in cell wall biosynthesis
MKQLTIVTTTFNSCRYLSHYLANVLDLDNRETLQVILVMNMPDRAEKEMVARFAEQYPGLLHLMELDHRETISASLNRGLAHADTPFVALWDVDDVRLRDSFSRQIETLERYSDADYTYGDFIMVCAQGEREGQYISPAEFDPVEFARGCHTSPTQLFRTNLLAKTGGFDEQLKSGGDFDFQVRAALNCKFAKTPGLLCYYTKFPESASASSNEFQPIERTMIEMRYGIFDKIDYRYVTRAQQYRIGEICFDSRWHPIEKFVPDYFTWMISREHLRPIGIKNFRRAEKQRRIASLKQSAKLRLRQTLVRAGVFDRLLPLWHRYRSRAIVK